MPRMASLEMPPSGCGGSWSVVKGEEYIPGNMVTLMWVTGSEVEGRGNMCSLGRAGGWRVI